MNRRHPAYLVVAGWGLANGVLFVVLVIYGESSFVLWLFGAVAAFLELVAMVVLISSRRGPQEHMHYNLPAGGGAAAFPAAVSIGLAALGFVYGFWLLALAVPLLAVAIALAVRRVRKGRSA